MQNKKLVEIKFKYFFPEFEDFFDNDEDSDSEEFDDAAEQSCGSIVIDPGNLSVWFSVGNPRDTQIDDYYAYGMIKYLEQNSSGPLTPEDFEDPDLIEALTQIYRGKVRNDEAYMDLQARWIDRKEINQKKICHANLPSDLRVDGVSNSSLVKTLLNRKLI